MQFLLALASTDQVYRRIIAGRKAMILTLRRVTDLGDPENIAECGEKERCLFPVLPLNCCTVPWIVY